MVGCEGQVAFWVGKRRHKGGGGKVEKVCNIVQTIQCSLTTVGSPERQTLSSSLHVQLVPPKHSSHDSSDIHSSNE